MRKVIVPSLKAKTQKEMDSILSRIKVAAEKVSVVKAVLGNKAGIVGATALAQERVERSD